MDIVCAQCGNKFAYEGNQNKKYCSERCKKQSDLARKRKTPRKIPCEKCGNIFTPGASNAKYCSPACYREASIIRMRCARKRYKRKCKNESVLKPTECICPKCGQRYMLDLFWTGTGTPRIYHPRCRELACYSRNGIEIDIDIAMMGG